MGHNAVAVLLTAGELAGIGLVISPAIIAEPGADEAKGGLFGE